jgi:hypothetical protein
MADLMNKPARSRLALLGALALAFLLAAALAAGEVSAAKKKKKKQRIGGTADITRLVGTGIPDATPGPPFTSGTLTSTIDVTEKKFQRALIRDVNVTIQTTGASGASPLDDLAAQLTAPNGATTWLIGTGLSGANLGPLTLDDETVNALTFGPPPARNPHTLTSPYVGVAQPFCFLALGGCTLSAMDGGPAAGTWTLRFFDATVGENSILNSWRLFVQAGRPFKTKR